MKTQTLSLKSFLFEDLGIETSATPQPTETATTMMEPASVTSEVVIQFLETKVLPQAQANEQAHWRKVDHDSRWDGQQVVFWEAKPTTTDLFTLKAFVKECESSLNHRGCDDWKVSVHFSLTLNGHEMDRTEFTLIKDLADLQAQQQKLVVDVKKLVAKSVPSLGYRQ